MNWTVNEMYREFFHLRCPPFEDLPDPQFFFPSADHDEALALLRFAASSRKGPVLLTGGLGTGKTLLCRTLLACPNHESTPMLGTCTAGDPNGLIRRVCTALNVRVPQSAAPVDDAERLRKFILSSTSPRRQTVLIVLDQIENLSLDQLEELHILCNIEDHGRRTVQLVLVGRSSAIETLDRPRFDQLRQRIFAFHRLRPFDADETAAYVRHRLSVAGNTDNEVFTTEALALIHERAGGIARVINHICDAALLAAYGDERAPVDADLIAEVKLPSLSLPDTPENAGRPEATPVSETPSAAPRDLAHDPVPEPAKRIESMLSEGETLARCLEQTLGRTESPAATVGADPNAQGLTDRLAELLAEVPRALETAERFLETTEKRIQDACTQAERITGGLERTIAQGRHVSRETGEKTEVIDAACDRANSTREELADYAERVVHTVERTRVKEIVDRAIERFTERSGRIVAEQMARLEAMVEACASAVGNVRSEVGIAEQKTGQLTSATHTVNAVNRQTVSIIAEANLTAEQLAQSISDQRANAEAVQVGLREAADNTQACMEASRSAVCQADAVIQSLAIERGAAQEKVGQLSSLVQAAGAATTQTADATRQAHTAIEELTAKVTQSRTTAEDAEQRIAAAAKDAEARINTGVETLSALDESLAVAKKNADELGAQTAAAKGESGRLVSLVASANQVETRVATVVDDARGMGDRLTAKMADGLTAVDALEHRIRGVIDEAQHDTADIEHRLHQGITTGRGDIEALEQRVADSIVEGQQIAALIERSVRERIASAQAASEVILRQTHEGIEQAQEALLGIGQRIEEQTARAQADAEHIEQRVDTALSAAAGQTEGLEHRLLAGIADGRARIEEVEQTIRSSITHGHDTIDRIDRTAARADAAIATLEGQSRAADERVSKIGEQTVNARRATDSLKDCLDAAREAIEGMTDRITQAQQTGQGLARSSAGTVAAMEHRHDELIDAIARQAAEATEAASRVAAQTAEDLSGRSAEAIEAVNRRAAEAAEGLSRKANELTQALAAEGDEANTLLARLIKAVRLATVTVKRLAGQREASLATIEHQQSLHQQDRDLIERLGRQADGVEQVLSALADVNGQGTRISERLTADCESASRVTERVAQQIDALDRRREVIDASDRTVGEFLEQAEALSGQIARVQSQADSVEVRIGRLLANPERILSEAKEQSAQLQSICRAVRKVFGGLSQATLQANQRIQQFAQISRTSESRVRRLSTETSSTAETLKAWVLEASRVQSRLAQSIERCPTIAQTHPVQSLHRLANLADRLDTLGADPPTPGERPTLDAAIVDSPASDDATQLESSGSGDRLIRGGSVPRQSRSDEIKHLIADAERLAEVVH